MDNVSLQRVTDMIGEPVSNLAGEILGVLDDVMVDVERGQVGYFVLAHGGMLGIGTKLFAIPPTSLAVNPYGRGFTVNLDSEVLDEARGFDKDNWPDRYESFPKFYGK